MFLLVLLFVVLLIYEEYNDFDREAKVLRSTYITTLQHEQNISINENLDIEAEIAQRKQALKKRLIKLMMEILSLGVIIFGFALIWAWIVHYIITKQVSTFQDFFARAAKEHILIDENEMMLSEFKSMVGNVNSMVDEIHKRKNKLRDMNVLLEQKVKQKTKDLSEKNILLEEAKSYSESLVKAQDSFIKHSIHEINTPLAVILMHLDIYKMKYDENEYISKVEAATKMIATIYDDLTYMVKRDRMDYKKEWLDMSDFLYQRIDFFSEIAKANNHAILSNIQSGVMVYFNPLELQRLIDNNLSNAIKYAKKESDITVLLYQNKENIILEFVTLSNKKIEDVEKIFYPFHREESSQLGLGLGLEIVRLICDKESIKIAVDSTEIATRFAYYFSRTKEDI
ncbi:MAG: ATP-binding protein [Sulfurovaceae bacterium]|nr:ATP-binding protein [Sulfurovaceae bacterium]